MSKMPPQNLDLKKNTNIIAGLQSKETLEIGCCLCVRHSLDTDTHTHAVDMRETRVHTIGVSYIFLFVLNVGHALDG